MTWSHVTDIPDGGTSETAPCVGFNHLLYVHDNNGAFNAYNPVADTWTALAPPLTSEGVGQLFAGSNGKLYLVEDRMVDGVQEYDPATDTWTQKAIASTTSRYSQYACDGTSIYAFVMNGTSPYPGVVYSDNGATNIAVYDIATDTWDDAQVIPPPTTALGFGFGSMYYVDNGVDLHPSLVYVNGWFHQDWPAGEIVLLDLTNIAGGWVSGSPEDEPREDQAFGCSNAPYVVVIGGDGGNSDTDYVPAMVSCEAYDPYNDEWDSLPDLPISLSWTAMAALDSYIYAIGGYNDATNNDQAGIWRMPYSDLPNGGGPPSAPPPPGPADLQMSVDPEPPDGVDTPGYIYVTINNTVPNSRIGFHLDNPANPEIDFVFADDQGDVIRHSVLLDALGNGTHHLYADADSPDELVISPTHVAWAFYSYDELQDDGTVITKDAVVTAVQLDGSAVTIPRFAVGATTALYDDGQDVLDGAGLLAADDPIGSTTDLPFTVTPPAGNYYIVVTAETVMLTPPSTIAHSQWLAPSGFTVNDTFVVANGDTPMPPPPVVTPPTLLTRAGVKRWYFQDPTGNSPDHYIFPRNPNPDGVGNPFADKNVQYMATTGVHGKAVAFEGFAKPAEWPVSGIFYTTAQEEAMRYWYGLPYRIYLIDHLDRAWTVYFTSLQVTAKWSAQYPEKSNYSAKFVIFDGPVFL